MAKNWGKISFLGFKRYDQVRYWSKRLQCFLRLGNFFDFIPHFLVTGIKILKDLIVMALSQSRDSDLKCSLPRLSLKRIGLI